MRNRPWTQIRRASPPIWAASWSLAWLSVLRPNRVICALLMRVAGGPVVPGHGQVVDRRFVQAQMEELAAAADHVRRARAEGRPVGQVTLELPWPADPYGREFAERADREPASPQPETENAFSVPHLCSRSRSRRSTPRSAPNGFVFRASSGSRPFPACPLPRS